MNWPQYPGWFKWVILLLSVLLVGESALWVHAHGQSRHALARCERLTREMNTLSRATPALDEANTRAIQRETEVAEQVLAAWHEAGPSWNDATSTAPAPGRSLDLFFELLSWVDRTRTRAADAQVSIRPDERFGFASLASEAPPAELAPAVWRQRQRLHYLLELLFAARPRAVWSVQREQPLPARAGPPQPPESGRATASPNADYFIPEPRLLIRSSGQFSSEAFRLEFAGETPVLRALLRGLASGQAPVLVRSVAVEPLIAAAPIKGNAEVFAASVPGPLVAPTASRFVVVVEWIERLSPTEKPAA